MGGNKLFEANFKMNARCILLQLSRRIYNNSTSSVTLLILIGDECIVAIHNELARTDYQSMPSLRIEVTYL
jgi:hypothetical protein